MPEDYSQFEHSNSQLAIFAMTKEIGEKIEVMVGVDWDEPLCLGRILGSGVIEQDN